MVVDVAVALTSIAVLVQCHGGDSLGPVLNAALLAFDAAKQVQENQTSWACLSNHSLEVLQTLAEAQIDAPPTLAPHLARLQNLYARIGDYVTENHKHPKVERVIKASQSREAVQLFYRELDSHWESIAHTLSLPSALKLDESHLLVAMRADETQEQAFIDEAVQLLEQNSTAVFSKFDIAIDSQAWRIRQATSALLGLAGEDGAPQPIVERVVAPLLHLLQSQSQVARSMKNERWRIDANTITDRSAKPIARGGFGEVYTARYFGSEVAVKELLCSYTESEIAEFRREIDIWHKLRHANVLTLVGACDAAERPFMVSPFMPNGTLRTHVSDPESACPLNEKLYLAHQVASGMAYLHGSNIIHGNLTTRNILLDESFVAVISDFGLSRTKHTSSSSVQVRLTDTMSGDLGILAPEMLDGDEPSGTTKKTDVYAFGILLYELLNDSKPTWIANDGTPLRPRIVERQISRGSRPKRFDGIPDDVWAIIECCWHQDPAQRPAFSIVLKALEPYRDYVPPPPPSPTPSSSSSPSLYQTSDGDKLTIARAVIEYLHYRTGNSPDSPDNGILSNPGVLKLLAAELGSAPEIPSLVMRRALSDDLDAYVQIGKILSFEKPAADPVWARTAQLFERAADEPHLGASFHLAWLYFCGIGVGQRDDQAISCWQLVSSKSTDPILKPLATLMLGWCHYCGRGTPTDKPKAIELIRQSRTVTFGLGEDCLSSRTPISSDSPAARQFFRLCEIGSERDWICAHLVAVCYMGGFGVTKDQIRSVAIFEKLASQDRDVSQYWLGRCYGSGRGVAMDHSAEYQWYSRSANQGNSYAQNMVGRCYENGWGVVRDYTKALEWYRKAVELGSATAQNNLGLCYENGYGVAADFAIAASWYRKAAEQGNMYAQYNLAVFYEEGRGLPKDIEKAASWYRQSADQGYSEARHGLEDLRNRGLVI